MTDSAAVKSDVEPVGALEVDAEALARDVVSAKAGKSVAPEPSGERSTALQAQGSAANDPAALEPTAREKGSSFFRGHVQDHALRPTLLGELHARPFEPISVPREFFHFAFLTESGDVEPGRDAINGLLRSKGGRALAQGDSFASMDAGPWDLRWEQHTEFATLRWGLEPASEPFQAASPDIAFEAPGKLVVATRVAVVQKPLSDEDIVRMFAPASLCVIEVEDGAARVLTDFQADSSGFTRVLVIDNGLGPDRAGSLIQRVLEIETYRTLALLGVPIARDAAPALRSMERALVDLTQRISTSSDMETNQELLKQITELAARLEKQAAETGFRFGASRAYAEIVENRLEAIRETRVSAHRTISAFFSRRLTPAISTCNAVEKRQERLALKLSRAGDLLRTYTQFELEQQNRDVLKAMNRRSELQLRLQQTVEGLSVVAISYYAIGLMSYLVKGVTDNGMFAVPVSAALLTALVTPPTVLAVWYALRRIREALHSKEEDK